MPKKYIILIVSLVILIIGGSLLYRFISSQSQSKINPQLSTYSEERLAAAESAIEDLAKEVADLKTAALAATSSATPNLTPLDFDIRLQNLEQAVAVLQTQVTGTSSLSSSSGTTTTITITKPPLYVTLGTNGTSTSTDFTANASFQIKFNPDDYKGYKNIQLEVIMKVLNGNGSAYARLYNSDAGTAVASSDVSTSSSTYTLVSSSGFGLNSGTHTYQIQMKSLTGYENSIQTARLKINF